MSSKKATLLNWISAFTGIAMMIVGFLLADPVFAARPYASGAAQGALNIEMHANETKSLTLSFKNTGMYAWKGTGKGYVSLYATGPYHRHSAFWSSAWPGAYQPARLSQKTVVSGKTGTVTFSLHAPATTGTYTEQFQLAVENTAWITGSAVKLSITVVPEVITSATPVSAEAYAVIDGGSGAELRTSNADEVRNIASLTKLMTVMVARESGLDPDATVTLEKDDEVGGGRLRVPVGTSMTVRNLVAAAIIGSANNAANALARATGFSREEFVRRMNAKAISLGLSHTSFVDPTGIEVGNVSTAHEVAAMAKAAFADPWISAVAALPAYDVETSRGLHPIKNTDGLLKDDGISVLAGKTGYINEAGYTFVTKLAQAGKPDVLVAVLGCDSFSQSFHDAKVLAAQTWQNPTLASSGL